MPDTQLAAEIARGLERSCTSPERERITAAPGDDGIERIEARFFGEAYARHRHDTYAVGLTLEGVQRFWYRGAERASLPGQSLVLDPDEVHDGGAGDDTGLRYRMLYVEPALVCAALGPGMTPPLAGEPVCDDPALRTVLADALGALDQPLGTLEQADVIGRLARSVLDAEAAGEAPAGRTLSAADLEQVTGLDRFALARHFRALHATSPHRYLVMRRLQRARALIGGGMRLAEAAAATGFADQSHFTRHFKKAFGLPPGRWAALTRQARR